MSPVQLARRLGARRLGFVLAAAVAAGGMWLWLHDATGARVGLRNELVFTASSARQHEVQTVLAGDPPSHCETIAARIVHSDWLVWFDGERLRAAQRQRHADFDEVLAWRETDRVPPAARHRWLQVAPNSLYVRVLGTESRTTRLLSAWTTPRRVTLSDEPIDPRAFAEREAETVAREREARELDERLRKRRERRARRRSEGRAGHDD